MSAAAEELIERVILAQGLGLSVSNFAEFGERLGLPPAVEEA